MAWHASIQGLRDQKGCAVEPRKPKLEKFKPGVPKTMLLFIAGLMWIGVGIMLDCLSYSWLRIEHREQAITMAVVGFACALVIHRFGFIRIVNRNLQRILPMEGKRCLFSFIPWKSYVLIAVMMMLGFGLRHAPIPKLYLAVLYAGIGTALIFSSFSYLRQLMALIKEHHA